MNWSCMIHFGVARVMAIVDQRKLGVWRSWLRCGRACRCMKRFLWIIASKSPIKCHFSWHLKEHTCNACNRNYSIRSGWVASHCAALQHRHRPICSTWILNEKASKSTWCFQFPWIIRCDKTIESPRPHSHSLGVNSPFRENSVENNNFWERKSRQTWLWQMNAYWISVMIEQKFQRTDVMLGCIPCWWKNAPRNNNTTQHETYYMAVPSWTVKPRSNYTFPCNFIKMVVYFFSVAYQSIISRASRNCWVRFRFDDRTEQCAIIPMRMA